MNELFAIMVSFLLFTSCTGDDKEKIQKGENSKPSSVQKLKTDWMEMGLKGKVKSIRGASDDIGLSKDSFMFIFNDKGNLLEEHFYNSHDKTDLSETINILSIEKQKNIYKYDDKGNRIEKNVYNPDGSFRSCKYDNKGNLIEEKSLNPDGSLYKNRIYTNKYDKEGNLIKGPGEDYNSDNYHTYKYDKNGNRTEDNFFSYAGGNDKLRFTSKYDDKGNRIEFISFDSDGSIIIKNISKYDEKENLIEEINYISDGSIDNKYTYKYDENGNKIEVNRYEPDGSLSSKIIYKYDYDKNLNWIKKIEEGTFKKTIERVVEYF